MQEDQVFEDLKKKLSKIKSQKKRQQLLMEYDGKFTDQQLIQRYNALIMKSKQKVFIPRVILKWGLILYIPAYVIGVAIALPLYTVDNLNAIQYCEELIALPLLLWGGFGPIVEIVMLILVLKKKKSKDYYLNIEDI